MGEGSPARQWRPGPGFSLSRGGPAADRDQAAGGGSLCPSLGRSPGPARWGPRGAPRNLEAAGPGRPEQPGLPGAAAPLCARRPQGLRGGEGHTKAARGRRRAVGEGQAALGPWSLGGSPRLPKRRKWLFGSGLGLFYFLPIETALGKVGTREVVGDPPEA